jgi:hypothetical protein
MRSSRATLLCFAVAMCLTAGATPVGAADPVTPSQSDRSLLSELRGTGARIARHGATGQLRFVGGSAQRPIAGRALLGRPATATAAADRFLSRYGSLFGLAGEGTGRRILRSGAAAGGNTFVRYRQLHRGVPVLGGEITVQVTAGGDVVSATGEAAPGLTLPTDPAVDASTAQLAALTAIAKARGLQAAPGRRSTDRDQPH